MIFKYSAKLEPLEEKVLLSAFSIQQVLLLVILQVFIWLRQWEIF